MTIENDSRPARRLWRAVLLLTLLRRKMITRAYVRDSSALVVTGALILILGPAALAAGADATETLNRLPPNQYEGFLRGFLGGAQCLWLLLILPGGASLLGQSLPASALRPFPVRPSAIIVAGTLGALLDIPLLFALALLTPLGGRICAAVSPHEGQLGAAIVVILTLACFAVQTALLSQLAEQAGAFFARQRRVSVALVAGLLLFATALAVLPGLTRPNALVREKVVLPPPAPVWLAVLPSGVTAYTLGAVSRGAWGASLLGLLGVTAYTGILFAGAVRLLDVAALREARGESDQRIRPETRPSRARPALVTSHARTTPVRQTLSIIRAELRALTRDPAAHLSLRQPALLLLVAICAWIRPFDDPNRVRVAGDLASMVAVLFPLLWQVQLLTNRFGNEAGTARLLLSFPVCRRRLIIGKNVAAFTLLLPLNIGFCVALAQGAGKPEWMGLLVPAAPVVLLVATIVGNPMSVLTGFPIRRRGRKLTEPNRALPGLYIAVMVGAVLGVVGVRTAFSVSLLAGVGAVLVLLALYVVSVVVSARLLQERERELMQTLDG